MTLVLEVPVGSPSLNAVIYGGTWEYRRHAKRWQAPATGTREIVFPARRTGLRTRSIGWHGSSSFW